MLRIGDFSRLARVTIRTLHHYDEAGLLRPAHIDAATGYRYYDAAQLGLLQRILVLKDLGFSLDEIRTLLRDGATDATFARQLERRRLELVANIEDSQRRLQRLEALRMSAGEQAIEAFPAVVLRDIPDQEVFSIRCRVEVAGESVPGMFESAEAAVYAHRMRAEASPFLLFHDPEYRERDVDVEVCIPVKASNAALGTRRLEGADQAGCVTYRGPYEHTQRIYESMLQWLSHSGLRIAGPMREVYHRFGADQEGYSLPAHRVASSSDDYVTELQVPVIAELTI